MKSCIHEKDGIITFLDIGKKRYSFRQEPEYAGPVFHVGYAGKEYTASRMNKKENGEREALFWGARLTLRTYCNNDGLQIVASVKNESSQVFHFDRLSLMLGLDTCMDHFPAWDHVLFPTLLRCEKTHFWGYFCSPDQAFLAIACPEPITSWALEYNQLFPDGGHLIKTVRLDLLSAQKQPSRHLQQADLLPNQEMVWHIRLMDAHSVEDALIKCADVCQAPVFAPEKLILQPDEPFETLVFSKEKPEVSNGRIEYSHKGVWRLKMPALNQTGLFSLSATASNHTSELIYACRHPWSFYLAAARNTVPGTQKTGTHCESWYGFFSAFLAARFLPEKDKDQEILNEFRNMLPLAFDIDKREPIILPDRIQNTGILLSLCEDAWHFSHDVFWLNIAGDFADYLIRNHQRTDGSFARKGVHYTCVIYVAKSLMELVLAERQVNEPYWQQRAEKHLRAAKAAVDDLVRRGENLGTEGEQTFEDGMISCAITQIAMMALLLPPNERKEYIEAAERMLRKHRCLERLGSVDARCRNTTIRFWEAQYDVLIPANFITSAHGWSAWKIYGVWYLYLLTGNTAYLLDTMETLGSCMNLVDENQTLRWAFAVDPCIDSALWKPFGEGNGHLERAVFGETYIDMISNWYRAPTGQPVWAYRGSRLESLSDRGGCCDNDVHECFKALAEVALPYAYLYENDGEIGAVNASIKEENGAILVWPNEDVVCAVHVNIKKSRKINVIFAKCIRKFEASYGWLYADGHQSEGLPEL